MWRRRAVVVYSSCTDMGPPEPKRNLILHVGRFTARIRCDYKHQGTLLEAFRGVPELHAQGWELHFVGSVADESSGRRALDEVRSAAHGLPVRFHVNASFPELRSLYRAAAIYWHATGYGTSAEERPQAQEHFGQTTVEAMSAGAVPIVIDSGGQRETVDHGVNGLRWASLAELREHTLRVAGDPDLRARLSRNAIESSKAFSNERFVERVDALAASLLSGQPLGPPFFPPS